MPRQVLDVRQMTQQQVIKRWPRLVAHMICESLGYFTPLSAANAILFYKSNAPFFCKMYCDLSRRRGKSLFDNDEVTKIGKEFIERSIQRRHTHYGLMADYNLQELAGSGPALAS